MPLYDFICENGHVKEVLCPESLQEMKCLDCGAPATRKAVHRVAAVFKGSGTGKTENAPLDIKVGRDSDLRWERYYNKFKKKEKIMAKNPDADIYASNDGYVAVNKDGSVDHSDEPV